jgi:hypothetical protein|tara:strand:- start:2656 stop:2805 length:150 start_codon:yes stop_codon:yes gene_type:complete
LAGKASGDKFGSDAQLSGVASYHGYGWNAVIIAVWGIMSTVLGMSKRLK